MKVVQTKINGITNPMGFAFDMLKCSWKVTQAKSRRQTFVRITVSCHEDLSEPVLVKEGAHLDCAGERLEINLLPRTRYYYQVEVAGEKGETGKSEVCWFETGKKREGWHAEFITTAEGDNFHPEFSREFELKKTVKQARLYICGLGVYEAYINGSRVGQEYLAPFTSDYSQKIQYQTYDVTEFLSQKNRLSVFCGNGWYKGRIGYEGHKAVWGDRFQVIAELRIRYEDGRETVIGTNEKWKYRGSDIEMSDIYDGEILNRLMWLNKENPWKPVELSRQSRHVLSERDSLPLMAMEELPVKEVIHTPRGEVVLDFGQNLAGYVEFRADFKAGTRISLDFGEVLQDGCFYNENYRTAKAHYEYISRGEKETVRPHFTYYGFRYVRVSGWEGELVQDMFSAKAVYSQMDITGHFETSDWRINKLFKNTLWGQKSNFLDMPTDCPQRDERLGWTGDAQVFAPTASLNMDTRAFFNKFLRDLRLEQKKWNGSVPNYIPNFINHPGGASVWGDAATFIPMTLYEIYGDRDKLEEYYPMMKDWVDSVTRRSKENGNHHLFDFGMHFGDWLAMDGVTEQSFKGGTDDFFVASVYYYASSCKVSQAAEVLGRTAESRKYAGLAERIKRAVLEEYFSVTGRLAVDTQAAYIISLRFGVYRDKERIVKGLRRRLEKDCYRIRCGFVGAPVICQVLSENGMEDIAYRILFYEGFPGWLRCINLGATTIWERWNSVLDDGRISGTGMNSLNHYAYGSVTEFLYRETAGIHPLEPGFGAVSFAPKFHYRLPWVKCSYDSVKGRYAIEYRLEKDGTIQIRLEVPFNCSARLELPDGSGEVREFEAGIHELQIMPERDYTRPFEENTTLEELSTSAEAMELLKQYLPAAVGMIASGDRENLSLTLAQARYMSYMGFEYEAVEKTIDKVKKIQMYKAD